MVSVDRNASCFIVFRNPLTVACSGNPDFLDDQSLIFVSPWSPCNLLSISAKFKFRTSATFFSLIFRLFFPTKSTILGKFYKNSTQIFEKFKIFIRFGIFDKFQQTKQIPDFFFDNCNMIKTRKRPIFLNFLLISACFFKRKCFVPPICFRCRRTKSGLYVSSWNFPRIPNLKSNLTISNFQWNSNFFSNFFFELF